MHSYGMGPPVGCILQRKVIYLSALNYEQGTEWWWKKIWKYHCPPKTRLFWWCILEDKVPCWDNLHKRGFKGPGWCALCQNTRESAKHLFLSCTFCVEVWKESCAMLGIDLVCRWERDNIMQA